MTGQSAMTTSSRFLESALVTGEGSQHASVRVLEPWCRNSILAFMTSPSGDVEGRLELQLHLSCAVVVVVASFAQEL